MHLDFLLIGAQKSATTLLHRCLVRHPDIFIPRHEITFFENPFYRDGDSSDLERHYRGAPPGTLRGLKRPDLLARPECPARIKRFAPEAKLIAIIRDPVDRAISGFHAYMLFSYLPLMDIETGIRRILGGYYDQSHPRARDVIEYGEYGAQLERYLSYFDRDQLHITTYEAFTRDTLGGLQRVCEFLGARTDYRPEKIDFPLDKGRYSPLRLRFGRLACRVRYPPAPDRSYLRGIDEAPAPPRQLVWSVMRVIEAGIAKMVKSRPPQISADLRAQLAAYYAADIEKTERLSGLDLSHWKQGRPSVTTPPRTMRR